MTRGMPLWSKSSADTPQSSSPNSFTRLISNLKQTPSQKTATKIVVMLRTVPEIEWHEIALWAEREGHPALSQRSSDFWNLVRSGPLQDLNELQANEGFEILKEAHRLGFKLSNGVLKEAQRLGIDLR